MTSLHLSVHPKDTAGVQLDLALPLSPQCGSSMTSLHLPVHSAQVGIEARHQASLHHPPIVTIGINVPDIALTTSSHKTAGPQLTKHLVSQAHLRLASSAAFLAPGS